MSVDEAIAIIAQHLLAEGAGDAVHDWENYPEIGEFDWDAVITKAADLAPFPDAGEYQDAYNLLTARAAHTGRTGG